MDEKVEALASSEDIASRTGVDAPGYSAPHLIINELQAFPEKN